MGNTISAQTPVTNAQGLVGVNTDTATLNSSAPGIGGDKSTLTSWNLTDNCVVNKASDVKEFTSKKFGDFINDAYTAVKSFLNIILNLFGREPYSLTKPDFELPVGTTVDSSTPVAK